MDTKLKKQVETACENENDFKKNFSEICETLSNQQAVIPEVFKLCKDIMKNKEDPKQRFLALFLVKELLKEIYNDNSYQVL